MLIKALGTNKKKNSGIKKTLVISFMAIILITMSALSFIAYIISKQALSTLGQTALNNRVNMGISMIEMLDNEIQKGKLTRPEAEEMFRQKMLGEKSQDGKSRPQNEKLELGIKAYMYAINSKGVEVMHPVKEGVDISKMVDPKGTNVSQLIIDEGNNKKNNGIIHFYWKNPGESDMKPKTNAVGYFKPWDWYINVGVYDEDFYRPAYKVLNAIILMTLVNLILGSLLMYFLISKRINPLREIKNVIEQAAAGNLVNRVNIKYNDEIGEMAGSFNCMLENVSNLVIEIKNSSNEIQEKSQNLSLVSEELAVSSGEVTKTMLEVSDCSIVQSTDISKVSTLLNEFTGNVEIVYSKLEAVKNEADNASSRASIGEKEVNNLVLSINNIREVFTTVSSNVDNLNNSMLQISKITNAINAISTSTNLLALNAAIEAARAGEAGKGFSVVADQVRKLAEESRNFTNEINDLVIIIQNDTSQVLNTTRNVEGYIKQQSLSVENAISSFENIIGSIDKIVPLMKDSYESMNQIAEAKDEILSKSEAASTVAEKNSTSSQQVASSSQQLAGSSQEVASTAQNLNCIANSLLDEVNRFNV